jgi:hypothetical protein
VLVHYKQEDQTEEYAYLVDHHDCKKVADSGKYEAIHVVGDALTDSLAECVDEDLADNEKKDTKGNVTQWPSILKSSHNEQDLHNGVDCEEYGAENVEDDEKANSVVRPQTGPALEGQDADDESNGEHGGRADSEQPDTQECALEPGGTTPQSTSSETMVSRK